MIFWTEQETELFKELYPKEPMPNLIKIFGRNKGAIQTKAHKMGIKKELKLDGSRPYTEEEIDFLKKNYDKYSMTEICAMMNRTPGSIKCMASKFGIKGSRWWTEEELKILKENYTTENKEYLCEVLKRNWRTIGKQARMMGLKRSSKNGKEYTANIPVEESELEFIKENCSKMTSIEMARYLGRSVCFVEFHCSKMGIEPYKFRKNPSSYTDEQLFSMLKDLETKLGRTPVSSDISRENGFPAVDIYYDRFGSLTNAFLLAGIDFEITNSYGRKCLSNSGDVCYSFSEKVVTDFLIDHNIKYEKDTMYRILIPDLNKKYRMDWLLKEDNTVVEFFGLKSKEYVEKTKTKYSLCERNNIKIIGIFEKDMRSLESIFCEYIN
jgi:hypothetical protein